ncbi:unnamed protein product [Effrenium voratum]|nr:unnamed protein product [Effrenium voratum]
MCVPAVIAINSGPARAVCGRLQAGLPTQRAREDDIASFLLAKLQPSQDQAHKYKTWQVQIARRKAGPRRETGRHWSGAAATCSFSCKVARCVVAGLSFERAVL